MISDERLEESINGDILFTDEQREMARELLAYRQAFSEPRAWVIHARGGDIITDDGHYVANAEAIAGVSSTELYRKPTIPE
ncbi:hypothetical protein [Pantoea ananatis]|uniref:hypothetical protein n=1 Tax=Pantoea ananas TaxID=553 RepID=UPI001B3033D5|nr:hypothetical protein [Pantoea ananatis]